MLSNIFIVLFTVLFLLIPILVWLYLYENFSHEYVKRRYIVFGMVLGSCITLPIILSSQTSLVMIYERIFSHLYLGNIFSLIAWTLGGILIVYFIFFFILSLIKKSFGGLDFLLYSLLMISIVTIIVLTAFIFLGEVPFGNNILLPESRLIFGIVFSSLTSILGYYLIVSLLEESGKFMGHLTQAHKKHYTSSLTHFLTFSVSVAVGFSFFENIIYVYMLYAREGIVGQLISLSFFRGIISLSLHVLCALLFSLGMWYFWNISQNKGIKYFFLRGYIFLIILSILSHTLFNLSLTFGYVLGVFLVFVGLYFVVAYILPLSQKKSVL